MRFTMHRALRPAAVGPGTALVSRPRGLSAVIAAALALGLGGQPPGDAAAAASGGLPADLRVGHALERIVVPGSAQGENRAVDVHLWYPADHQGLADLPKSVYSSALHGEPLPAVCGSPPAACDPLSWTVGAEIAREDAAIDPDGQAFPVIVFSHGSVNDPIDYAHTLELIAGAGFVVAAPSHVNNTQDDVRIDFINSQAGVQWFACGDGRPRPCSRPNVPFSMADRVRDISKVLDELPGWFGDRVDTTRAGVLGHSRGTATALAAAGGSAPWSSEANCQPGAPPLPCWASGFPAPATAGLEAEPRVKAIMGMAIAAERITRGVKLANITVPALLVAAELDQASPQAVSKFAFEQIASTEKAFVSIDNAVHRSFDSTYCDQTQAAGAIAQAKPLAILDLHTIRGTVAFTPSGQAIDYCPFSTFTNPADIRPLVASLTGFNVTADNVPRSGPDTDEVKQGMKQLAVTFFGTVLKRTGNDGPHFTRYLAPKWLEQHEPMVDTAEACASADAIYPPGQATVCED
jgi:predicted dienelactone hydrolase